MSWMVGDKACVLCIVTGWLLGLLTALSAIWAYFHVVIR